MRKTPLVISIVGARPQFIKASVVSSKLRELGVKEILIHTGQHYDFEMSDVFFSELKLPKPDHFLGIGGLSHGKMTGKMIEKLEEIFIREKPSLVVVYGDTNSTLAGAISAVKLHIPVAHVEAGMRSFKMTMPEEINRVLTDRISTLLFCSTKKAYDNLRGEGFPHKISRGQRQKIFVVGDVMKDSLFMFRCFAKKPKFSLPEKFVVATVHREENTENEDNLRNIIQALREISREIPVVFPAHPRTKKKIEIMNLNLGGIMILPPLSYLEMIYLVERSELVITDSGGLQKEAFLLRKKCITLREETEWVELVEGGYNTLAGAKKTNILKSFRQMMSKKVRFSKNLYGDGNASGKIAKIIHYFLKEN